MSTPAPDLDTILFDLHLQHPDRHPTHAEVTAWCRRFPEHREAIADHCVAWVLCEVLCPPARVT